MLALDTEDDSKGNPRIINFFNGVEHFTFTGKTLRVDAWDFLSDYSKNYKRLHVWACNCEYDIINLFGFDWIGKLVTLQYVSSGLMRGFYKEGPITFLDTLRHWAMSVQEMGEFIGLPKLEADFESIVYCQRDTEIVYRFVERMLSLYEALGLKIKSTLPSMALQLFKKFYTEDFPQLPEASRDLFHRAYFGGRVEVYQYGSVKIPMNHYDINSLFPSVMLSEVYPKLSSWRNCKTPDFEKEGVFEGWVTLPETYFPCLPVREDEEILYAHGGLFGAWTYPEVRQMLEDGGRIVHIKECIEFSETERPFVDYVTFCYSMRLRAGNDCEKLFYKLLMNSLYGKFAQSKGITTIYYDKKLKQVVERGISSDSSQSNVIWSAYTTAYARLKLLAYLRSCSRVFYTDTDSLFTPDSLPISIDLGALKLEGRYKQAEFRGNKLYIVDKKVRAKGVPNRVRDEKGNLIFDEEGEPVSPAKDFIRTGRAIFRRPARYREALKTFAKANVWYEVEKRLEKRYTKRQVFEDGSTIPWKYGDYKRMLENEANKARKNPKG